MDAVKTCDLATLNTWEIHCEKYLIFKKAVSYVGQPF